MDYFTGVCISLGVFKQMLKNLILIGLFIFTSLGASAQRPDRHADNWLFGSGASIFFPFGGEPDNSGLNTINTENAFMSYSDELGNLILYSNGSTVWNKNGNPIEGAQNLINAPNPVYPGLIVPFPESDNLFYVFSVDDFRGNNNSSTVEFPIFYSKIDINENGGEGEKIGSTLSLSNETSFGMTTVKHCNNIDYWLIIHKGSGNEFLSYLIDKNGLDLINPPVSSKLGFPFVGSSKGLQQEIIVSEDGKKLAVTKPFNPEGGFVQIFDFDNITGEVTQLVTTYKNEGMIKGAAFSPDGNFIYVSRLNNQSQTGSQTMFDYELVQFRTSFAPAYREQITKQTYTGQSEVNLGTFLVDPGTFGNLKLGPNGKIYLAHIDDSVLSVIHEPNKVGTASNFEHRGFDLGGKVGKAQLPSTVSPDYPVVEAKIIFTKDSLTCNPTLSVELKNIKTNDATFQWFIDDIALVGATSINLKTTTSGNYMVKVKDNCKEIQSPKKEILSDAKITAPVSEPTLKYCQGEEIKALYSEGDNIKWYSNASLSILLSSGSLYTPPLNPNLVTTKSYYATQTQNDCESGPTKIEINILEAKPLNIGEAVRKECFNANNEIELKPTEVINSSIQWLFDGNVISNETIITVNQYGSYILKKVDTFCPSADTVLIDDACIEFYFSNAFTPNGDGVNEDFKLYGNGQFEFDFEVKDKRGTVMYITKNKSFNEEPILLWNGSYGGKNAPAGIYSFFFRARAEDDGQIISQSREGIIKLLR